jgi:hypothetical protein
VNLTTLTLGETGEYGLLRLIVPDPEEAKKKEQTPGEPGGPEITADDRESSSRVVEVLSEMGATDAFEKALEKADRGVTGE